MSSEPAIQVSGLGKMYRIYDRPVDRLKQMLWGRFRSRPYGREFWALTDFSCSVPRGSMLGVIGRNGSGKSTLLQILAGTLAPTTGTVTVRGRISALLELGSGFNPEFTGRDNVFLAGAIIGLDHGAMADRLAGILEFADIGEFIDQPVKTYSSGMAVRLAFAVASSVDPEILIVDEALAVGDLVFQQKCYRRFQQIRDRGTTVIFVTHDLGSVIQYCDRAMVLHRGRVIGEGVPKMMVDLYKRSQAAEISAVDRPPTAPVTGERFAALFPANPSCEEYGDGVARIDDWALLGPDGKPTTVVADGQRVEVLLRLRFFHSCTSAIAAFTIRDLKGQDIAGANTWYEDCPIGLKDAGSSIIVRFRFLLPVQPGGYALSLGCTEQTDDGLVVHHRLYDVLIFEVVSTRRTVGVVDVHPEIILETVFP